MVVKLLMVLAEKPQCESLSDARNVSTDSTVSLLLKDFIFQSEVTAVFVLWEQDTLTLWAARVCLGSGSQAGL